jgi:hypothetical protein
MDQNNPGSPLDGLIGTGTEASNPEVKVENTLTSNHGSDHGEGRRTDRDPRGVQALRIQSPQGSNNHG